jgi:hypothetical protein
MSPFRRRLLPAIFLLSLALASCLYSQGTTLRSAFLKELGTDLILPAYQELDTRSEALAGALATLEASPSRATLTEAQSAWRTVRFPWGFLEALHLGPSEELHTGAAMNQVPGTTDIDTLLAGNAPLDETSVAQLGANLKGMLTIEYVLFDAEAGNEAVLSRLTTGDAGARRRAYLKALGAVLHADARAVRAAWEPEQGNYLAQLSNAGSEGSRYATQQEALDEVVHRLISSVEEAELKLSPELEATRHGDNSLEDLESTLRGMEYVWHGLNGDGGLSSLVSATNKSLDKTVREELALVRLALVSIPPPLRTALRNNPASVEKTRAAFSNLRATLATKVVANLEVTPPAAP